MSTTLSTTSRCPNWLPGFVWGGGFTGADAISLGVHTIWDDDLGRQTPVVPGEQLEAAFECLCMGWSWSLYFCQRYFEGVAAGTCHEGSSGLFQEKTAPPKLREHRFVGGVYVDNYNTFAVDKVTSKKSIDDSAANPCTWATTWCL